MSPVPLDSPAITGGSIPGSPDQPAYSLRQVQPSQVPVLIAVPHAGRAYPHSLIERMRHPGHAALRLEDRYADLLMFSRGTPPDVGSYTPGRRARSGLGLIPRRLPGLGELWKRRHDEDELAARIREIHEPYHACLAEALAGLRERWGAARLLDLHSMPPLSLSGGQPAPEFVLGDRFGTSCHGALVGSCFGYFAEMRRGAAHNRPYAGGYVLERHGAPADGVHALQLEIDRSSYLDSRLVEPGAGFDAMVDLLSELVCRLAAEVAGLGRINSWSNAAE